jgi:serine phosphatase RsbU (regulator of sigma subunit)
MRKYIFVILNLISIFGFAQKKQTDSIFNVILHAKNDSVKSRAYLDLGDLIGKNNTDSALYFYNQSYRISEKNNDKKMLANALLQMGQIFIYKGDYQNALVKINEGLNIRKTIADTMGMAECLNSLGSIFYKQGNYNLALQNFQESLNYCDKIKFQIGISFCLNNIGLIHQKQENFPKALEYYQKALKISEKENRKQEIAGAQINIAIIFGKLKKYKEAFENLEKALTLMKEEGNSRGVIYCLRTAGGIYMESGNYIKAVKSFEEALLLIEKMDDKNAKASTYRDLAHSYNQLALNTQNSAQQSIYFSKAISFADESLFLARQMKALPNVNDAFFVLSTSYAGLGNYKKAYENSQQFIQTKDSLFSSEKTKAIEQMEAIYQNEKKQQQIELQNTQLEKQNAERKFLIAGLLGVLLVVVVVIFAYAQKRKDNQKIMKQNVMLQQNKEEITAQRDEIEVHRDEIQKQRDIALDQRDKIQYQNKQITDSIQYASRIQNALLPLSDEVSGFMQHFVLFKPRDIVSGDFYWIRKVKKDTRDLQIIIAADCTGHGVPGAFVSMLGISFLNEIILGNDVTDADEILNILRERIKKSLHQTSEFGSSKDGMDIALCIIDSQTMNAEFAGAHNPMLITRTNFETKNVEIVQLDADRQPVGIYMREKPFTKQNVQLFKNDSIYMFSDGFVDQFGGGNNSKFKSARFKELIKEIHFQTPEQQREALNAAFENWKGQLEQIDDVLVLGLKCV